MKSIKAEFWLGGLVVIMVVVNVLWLTIDKTPPAWDQAAHIRSVILASRGGNIVEMVRSFGGYPPLIYWLGGLWTSIVGVGVVQVTILNSLFLLAAIVGVYRLGGLLPAVVFSLMPVIYDISRNMLLDLPLTVFVIWGLLFWLNRNDIGLLSMLVLASLTKLNGFIYFGPMVIYMLVSGRRDIGVWTKLLVGAAIYLAVVGWWWIVNFQNIYQYLTGLAGQGEKLTDPMNLLSLTTWIHYFRLFFLHQVGPIMGIVAIISWFKIDKASNNKKLIYWSIFVYIIFTIIKNKDFRFTMPLLPVVAVFLGQLLEKINKKIIIFLFIFYLIFQYVENSFGWPVHKPVLGVTPTFLVGEIEWIGWDDYPVRAASGTSWPQGQIVADLDKLKIDSGKTMRVLVLINKEEINDNNLGMYKELYRSQAFELGSVGNRESFESEVELINLIEEFDGVLVAEKSQEPAPFYGVNLRAYEQARDWILDHPENFQLVSSYKIFGDRDLFLFRNAFVN